MSEIPGKIVKIFREKFYIIIPLLVGGVIYFNSLHADFFWDDRSLITNNNQIKTWSSSVKTFLPSAWGEEDRPLGQYRPLRNLTFTFDYGLWLYSPFGYHLTNNVLNLLSVFFVSLLVFMISRDKRIALFAGLIFAVHPSHMETINYIKNRGEMLCFAGMAASFYFLLSGRKAWSVFFYALSLFSKEYAVVLPFLLLLYLVLKAPGYERLKFRTLTPYFLLSLAFMLFVALAVGKKSAAGPPDAAEILKYNPLLLIFTTLAEYLKIGLFPFIPRVDIQFAPISGLFDPRLWLFAGLIAVFFVLVRKTYAGDREKTNTLIFSLACFFAFLAPVSNLMPLTGRALAEQRLYIPSFGLAFFVSALAVFLGDKYEKFKRPIRYGLLLWIAAASLSVVYNNGFWKSEVALWERAVVSNPANWRAHSNLASNLFRVGDYEKSWKVYVYLLKKYGPDEMAYSNMGVMSQSGGDIDGALKYFQKALELNPKDYGHYLNLGSAWMLKGDRGKAEYYYKKSLEINPNTAAVYTNLGVIYVSEKKFKEAAAYFRKAVEIDPDLIDARLNLANVYRELGLLNEAEKETKEADLRSKNIGVFNDNPGVIIKNGK